MTAQPFVPPPYPYDRLNELKSEILERHDSVVDLSIGTPFDPPPPAVVAALSTSGAERSYPPSVGTPALHAAVQRWLARRFDVSAEPGQIGATVGSKEFVALLPQFMGLRSPDRDTVLYPGDLVSELRDGRHACRSARRAGCDGRRRPARPRLDRSPMTPSGPYCCG